MVDTHTRALAAAAFAGMFVFGIVMALLGAVMPALSAQWSLSLSDVGAQFLMMNFAMLATSLVLGLAMDRFGLKLPLALGASLVAIALLLIALAPDATLLPIAVLCLGIGGGALNGGTNTLIADLHDDPREKSSALNMLGVFFGVGALCLPFSLGALMSRFGLAGLLLATAAICAAAGLAAAALRFPVPKQQHRLPIAEMPRFLREPLVLLMGALLFFQSGNEFVLGGYLATFLTRELSMSLDAASYALAAFWAAIMIGRMVLSRLLLHASGPTVILVSALLSAIGAFLIGLGTASTAILSIVITGIALAGIFPTVLGIAGTRYREHSGTVFGLLFTIALTGGMLMPWIAGLLAQALDVRAIFPLVSVNFLVIAVLATQLRRFCTFLRA